MLDGSPDQAEHGSTTRGGCGAELFRRSEPAAKGLVDGLHDQLVRQSVRGNVDDGAGRGRDPHRTVLRHLRHRNAIAVQAKARAAARSGPRHGEMDCRREHGRKLVKDRQTPSSIDYSASFTRR